MRFVTNFPVCVDDDIIENYYVNSKFCEIKSDELIFFVSKQHKDLFYSWKIIMELSLDNGIRIGCTRSVKK